MGQTQKRGLIWFSKLSNFCCLLINDDYSLLIICRSAHGPPKLFMNLCIYG